MGDIFNMALLQNTLRTAAPIVLCAMGGLFTEHAGLMNIGMDGMMLIGAFAAVTASYFFGSALMGILFALLCGLLVGLFFALFVVKFRSDEFIIGVALNIFAGGLTVFLLRTIFGVKGSFSDPAIAAIPALNWDALGSVPILGDLLNGHTVLVYVSLILVFVCYIVLYKTPLGFKIRAAGESPDALRSVGVNPNRMKTLSSVICGMFCTLAGAHLSLGYLTLFSEGMSANKGFIAFACIIFGRANPAKVFLATLFFGFLDALGLRLQSTGVPSNLTEILPYLMTVLALVYAALRQRHTKHRLTAKSVREYSSAKNI